MKGAWGAFLRSVMVYKAATSSLRYRRGLKAKETPVSRTCAFRTIVGVEPETPAIRQRCSFEEEKTAFLFLQHYPKAGKMR